MTKKRSPGDSVVAVVLVSVGLLAAALLVVVFDVLLVVVVFDDAADAEPATNTASVAPSEPVTSVGAVTAAALRRGVVGLLTTYLPCRSPAPRGSRALPGAGRVGLRSHCGLPPRPGSRSSPAGRLHEGAGRRSRRSETPSRRRPRRSRPRPDSCP